MSTERKLWAALPLPALLIDSDDIILSMGPATEQFLMASERTLIGKPLFDVLIFDSDLGPAFERARLDDAPLFVNDVGVARAGRVSERCDLQLAPYDADNGQMLLLITPLGMGSKLPKALGPKTAARSAIGMAEMLAHEIKNPLAGITGAAQLLSMGLTGDDRELTDLIVAESRRIVKLLEQVEEFGNLSPPQLGPVNLHDVLDRARRSALLGVGAATQIIEEYDPSLPDALADADQILQVLLNLLKNASEATGAGGVIRLRTSFEHGFRLRTEEGLGEPLPLQIEVIDNGPGIAPDMIEQIFDPFVSGRENGTGLGLALTAKIMAAHGGWVSVRSEPGETIFKLSLPRAPQRPKGA
ncbi:two-component system sensor histidine kinase NtrB [Lentibacter sp. XHP0401]|jgi:two-component system, NtrC family, nitrogen regulation sensor histidine kinase GlnL|uniref:two-component system sensor histidine kinase NtrB n=1 Tax=Lentibacter sp. XHP0401 TaxID=2984334 RepID=UPI0021E6ECD2|nr:ATP-binding protein [Lentibacter sp. XHP0401]MCV2892333.1 ATP-binding protein [Lentibacter sp. XHP0401]